MEIKREREAEEARQTHEDAAYNVEQEQECSELNNNSSQQLAEESNHDDDDDFYSSDVSDEEDEINSANNLSVSGEGDSLVPPSEACQRLLDSTSELAKRFADYVAASESDSNQGNRARPMSLLDVPLDSEDIELIGKECLSLQTIIGSVRMALLEEKLLPHGLCASDLPHIDARISLLGGQALTLLHHRATVVNETEPERKVYSSMLFYQSSRTHQFFSLNSAVAI